MEKLLDSTQIVRIIDQAGNHNGIAELTDIQRISSNDAGSIDISTLTNEKLRTAFVALTRICGGSSKIFQTSSLLNCGVIMDGKFDPITVRKAEDFFIIEQFRRLFSNQKTPEIVMDRYKEFYAFVTKHNIPFVELYNVVENCFYFEGVPPEETPLENVRAETQMTIFSLFAAMWYFKNTLQVFSTTELKHYPSWFSGLVEGFEYNILERLKKWDIVPMLGKQYVFKTVYSTGHKAIITSEKNPFPTILGNMIPLAWHELFHAFRTEKVAADFQWKSERDANIVEGLGLLQMNHVRDPKDPRIAIILKESVEFRDDTSSLGFSNPQFHEDMASFYRYALSLRFPDKKTKESEDATEDAALRHVINNLHASSKGNFSIRVPDVFIREDLERTTQEAQEVLDKIKDKKYKWPSSEELLPFLDILEKLNDIASKHPQGLDRSFVETYGSYIIDISNYIEACLVIERNEILLSQFTQGTHDTFYIPNGDFQKTLRLIKHYKWVVWIISNPRDFSFKN